MGRGKRFVRKHKNRNGKRERGDPKVQGESKDTRDPNGGAYDSTTRENEQFEIYYKIQKIVPEEEWDDFLKTLKEPLPAAFRITGYRSQAQALLKIIEGQYFRDLGDEQVQPKPLTWYPGNTAWQLNLTRKDIRKTEAYVRLHNFLVSETNSGNISRQETVSMIPPLVLDVKPNHRVLDMCAAPGSKTAQLIEMVHQEESTIPEGFVVANDAANNRCYMLVHQAKRMQSPCIVITNHDASIMPNIEVPLPDGNTGNLKFDRILCDVPCSGDGTVRKNIDIWEKWNTANGQNLHGLQYRIAKRGTELLAVKGRIVYSTCSLNPVEDEAVIARLLLEAQGSLQLVDISDKLPGLKFCKGTSNWVVMNRDMTVYDKVEDLPEKLQNLIRPSMFPPSPEDAAKLNLDRCIRVLPQQQNTGGFFVALLEKVAPLPWESQAKKEASATTTDEAPKSPTRKKRRTFGYKEDPFVFLNEEDPDWKMIKEFYGLSSKLQPNHFFVRCKEGKKNNIYFTTRDVGEIVRLNEKIKIVNTGVKVFVRSENKGTDCCFRIAQEGVSMIVPFVEKRKARVAKEDMVTLLLNDDMEFPPEISSLSPEAARQLNELGTGTVVLEYEEDDLHIPVVGWKGKNSVRAYIAKMERIHYLRLCGGDVSKFETNKFKERTEGGAAPEDADEAAGAAEKEAETEEAATIVADAVTVKQEI